MSKLTVNPINTPGTLTQTLMDDTQSRTLGNTNNINQLQSMEKGLLSQLKSVAAGNGNAAEQEKIIKKINELSSMRMNLFSGLTDDYAQLQNSVAGTRTDLVDQMTVVGMVESELNDAKGQLNQLETVRNNNQRMAEINTYFGKRYEAHTGLLQQLVIICIPILILAILNKQGIISGKVLGGIQSSLTSVTN